MKTKKYVLSCRSGQPLEETKTSQSYNKAFLIRGNVGVVTHDTIDGSFAGIIGNNFPTPVNGFIKAEDVNTTALSAHELLDTLNIDPYLLKEYLRKHDN